MSGILVAFGDAPIQVLRERIARMADAAPHRGQVSTWAGPGVVIGVQGSGGGASIAIHPAAVVAANGYVGNWGELAQRFAVTAVSCPTARLADKIGGLVQAAGVQAWALMRGEYTAVLWSRDSDEIIVAGDLVGSRPLVTAYSMGVRVLAGEVRQVLAGAQMEARLDAVGLIAALMDHPAPAHRTLFDGVARVSAEAVWAFSRHDPASAPKSAKKPIPFDSAVARLGAEEAAEELLRRLKQAVLRALPGGSFAVSLSGGLDSGAIVGILARLGVEGAIRPEQCLPVSLVYPGRAHDEYEFIAATLAHVRMPGVLIDDRFSNPAESAKSLIERTDCLFGGTAYQIDCVADAAVRRGRRVVMNGVGGDEWLGGVEAAILDGARQGCRCRAALAALRLRSPSPSGARPLRVRLGLAARCLRGGGIKGPNSQPQMARPPWLTASAWASYRDLSPAPAADEKGANLAHAVLVRRLTALQQGDYFSFVGQRASVLGIELRHPWMDQDLIEFGFSVRGRWLLLDNRYKGLLRRALRDVLPTAVLTRVARTVFDDHVAESMAASAKLGDPRSWLLSELGVLAPGGVDKLLDGLYSHSGGSRKVRGARRVWLVWCAEQFCRNMGSTYSEGLGFVGETGGHR